MNPKYTLQCDFKFDAAHRLLGLPEDHPCGRMHGHTWRVAVRFEASHLDEQDMIIDFTHVKHIVGGFVNQLDHHTLNDVFHDNASPTCEVLAQWFFRKIAQDSRFGIWEVNLTEVTVWESTTTSVTYSETDQHGA